VKKIHILLAEANHVTAMAVAWRFEKRACRVERVTTSEEVWEKYQSTSYDLILINTMLPNSLEIVRKIREAETKLNGKMTPIIGIYSGSSRDKKSQSQKCFRAGMNDVFILPLRLQDRDKIFERYLL
jgi:CheY-like chemotaxis protein